jgi:hypothetical protein
MGKPLGKSDLIAKCLTGYLIVTGFKQLTFPIYLVNIMPYTG